MQFATLFKKKKKINRMKSRDMKSFFTKYLGTGKRDDKLVFRRSREYMYFFFFK